MKVLVVTNMYPTAQKPDFGTFVKTQIESERREGVEIDVFFVNGEKSKLNYLWGIFRFWAKLLSQRYDLIHAHYVFSGIIARLQFLYPVVLTHHGSQVFLSWQARLCRWLTPFMDRAIVVSQEMKERGRLNKVNIIPCGIDLELFKPAPKEQARKKLGLPGDKKLVLFAGEYYKLNKRYDIVQNAVRLLQENDPDVELILVSGKPLNVIPEYMNACDALVLASNSEGSPMVIKEAMACNLPLVAVPVGDVPEVIGGTEGCYLCSQDPEDVAAKLRSALLLGKRTNGREKIKHLEIGVISRRIIALYEGLLEEKKGHGLSRLWFWGNHDRKALKG
jgi:teichuronic acid biosynthesis glycosyltransferase TuaC